MPRQLRVGIVGCGVVAQIIHTPTLRELPELFRITALCDVSPSVLAAVGAEHPDAALHEDATDLVRSSDVDVVLVANPHVYHAEVALMAMAAGKHVLVEKPMCITLNEADQLLSAEEKAGVIVQVGYMRRYAPAFVEAVKRTAGLRDEIILARVHDVIGPNATIIDSTSRLHRATDIDPGTVAAAKAFLAEQTRHAIGEVPEPLSVAYGLLLGLCSHDVSAMRELIGMPKGVLYAAQRRGGRMITAAFDYGGFVCQFESGVDSIAQFDAHLEVYTRGQRLRVDYDTPFVRHLPARLTVTGGVDPAGVSVETRFATRNDSFVAEWRAFHANITGGTRPKTSIEDARNDLILFKEMVARMA
ncbi:MAG: Gfo/Idh/MocA family oxidoreductase [Pseudomonadota bacterium]